MEIFAKDLVKIDYYAINKESLINEMVEFLYKEHIINDMDAFLRSILERESIMSTGIGNHVAIPHTRSESVKRLAVAVYLLKNEIDYDSIDDEPVKVVFMIAVPEDMKKKYMILLATISNFLSNEENHSKLLNAKSEDEVYNLLKGLTL